MRGLLRTLDRSYYAAAPAERLAAVRVLVGAFAVVFLLVSAPRFWALAHFPASELEPVGPLFWLEAPLGAVTLYAAFLVCLLTGVAFTVGYRYGVAAPIFALLLLLLTTYRSSFGMKFHTENLLVLHVMLLAAAPAADAWALRAAGPRSTPSEQGPSAEHDSPAGQGAPGHGRYGWALRAMSVVTVLTYVLAGIAKLRNGGWDWVNGDLLRAHIAYDNVRKIELGSLHSPLGAAVVRIGWLFPILGWLTMAVELLAPVALWGRRWALGWALLAWSFHAGVLALMTIGFPYPLSFVAYASLFRAERVRELPWLRRFGAPPLRVEEMASRASYSGDHLRGSPRNQQ